MGGYIKIKDHHSPAEAEIGTELGKKSGTGLEGALLKYHPLGQLIDNREM